MGHNVQALPLQTKERLLPHEFLATSEERDPIELSNRLENLRKEIEEKAIYLSLDECIEMGINSNPQIEIAFQTIQSYEWSLIAAKRQWYPKLQLQNGSPFVGRYYNKYKYTQYDVPLIEQSENSIQTESETNTDENQIIPQTTTQSITQTTESQTDQLQPGISVTWDIIKPTRQSQITEAEYYLDQQKLLFDSSARTIVLEIQKNYFALQSTIQLIDSYKEIFTINLEQLRVLNEQVKVKMATSLDVAQTEAQLYQNFNSLISLYKNYIVQASDLSASLGLAGNKLVIPANEASKFGSWELPLAETIDRAVANREEIKASIALADAYRWSGITSLREYLPVFQLIANGSMIVSNGFENKPEKSSPEGYRILSINSTGSLGLGFTWSIFDGGIKAAEAKSMFEKAKGESANTTKQTLDVVNQIRSSYGQMMTAQIAIESAKREYEAAQIAQEVSRERFKVGVGYIFSVVQSIQQLAFASQQLSYSMLEYNNAIADLYRYSATWPDDVQKELQNRIVRLESK